MAAMARNNRLRLRQEFHYVIARPQAEAVEHYINQYLINPSICPPAWGVHGRQGQDVVRILAIVPSHPQ